MAKAAAGLVWTCSAVLLVLVVVWRTIAYPYTKVEESFTIQAVHDLLAYSTGKSALPHYDHQVFAGAVPRSFIGPLLLAGLSYPWILSLQAAGALKSSVDVQLVVRLVLGLVNAFTLIWFGKACFGRATTSKQAEHNVLLTEGQNGHSTSVNANVSEVVNRKGRPSATATLASTRTSLSKSTLKKTDHEAPALFLLITACQLHFGFWCSRTIPNSLALPFVLSALALVVRNLDDPLTSKRAKQDYRTAIFLLTFSAVVLRLEIVATLAPVGLYLLFTRRLTIVQGAAVGLQAGVLSIFATTLIDTYFWQDLRHKGARGIVPTYTESLTGLLGGRGRPLWPELEGLLFNVVEGKSSEWGVSPWHTYVTAFLPKLLGFAILFLPFGLLKLSKSTRFLLVVAVSHTAVLSLLGHKEWRFVVYCLPAFNSVAALGARKLSSFRLGVFLVLAILALQMASSEMMGYISGLNYPGGVALSRFHELVTQDQFNLHIDVLPAMTGVTLFQSEHLNRNASISSVFAGSNKTWTYDKTEDLPTTGPDARDNWLQYTHLLSEHPHCRVLQAVSDEQQPFEPLADPVQSYTGLRRKQVPVIRKDVLKLLSSFPVPCRDFNTCRRSVGQAFRLLLPVEIVEEDAVWLCRRTHGAA